MPSTLCHIVLTVVSCVVNPATPPSSPEEAIAILIANLGPSRVPPPAAPEWVYRPAPPTPASDQEGLFPGSFAPTWWPSGYGYGPGLLYDPWLSGRGVARGSRRSGGRPDGGGGRPDGRVGRPDGGVGRPDPRVTRPPSPRQPVTRTPPPSTPRPPTAQPPLAAPGGSVRTKVGRD